MIKATFLTTLIVVSSSAASAGELKDFNSETKTIAETIKCKNAKITKTAGLPDLWGCILLDAEVLKVFVNASEDGSVQNVKVIWNDWTRDIGYGVHVDAAIAEDWVKAITAVYAPLRVQEVIEAFRGKSTAVITEGGISLKYTYFKGPAIDERMIVINKN